MAKHSKGKHAAPTGKIEKAPKKDIEGQSSEASDSASAPSEDVPSGDESSAKDDSEEVASETAEDGSGKDGSSTSTASDAAVDPGDKPDDDGTPISMPKERHRIRTALIATGCTIGVLGIVYLVGVGIFSTHFMPNTSIAGMDFSLKTPEEMQSQLDSTLADHAFDVVGKGLNFKVTSEEAGLTSDSEAVAADVLGQEDAWAWPLEVFQDHDCTESFTKSMHADGIEEIVSTQVEALNAQAVQPVNATVGFDEAAGKFVGIEEVKGTAVDPEALKETILEGLLHLEDKIVLTDEVLIQPTIFIDDPRIQAAADQANEYTKADFDVVMSDSAVAHVGPALTAGWVSVSPELEIAFDEGSLSAWASEVAAGCNTVGSTRSYTRPDGKAITVSGGTYGWKIDKDALVAQVVEAVKAGSTEALAVPVLQSGTGFTGLGGQDWGSRYIDVDLSEQYARYYDNGQIIWESVIVSGNPNKGKSTPTGVYSGNQKASPTVLRGRIQSDGKPEYESPVKYWMPFIGNSVGFHDASWQSAYGGSRYLTNGSRGCINLPYNSAKALYGIFSSGDVVVVHR